MEGFLVKFGYVFENLPNTFLLSSQNTDDRLKNETRVFTLGFAYSFEVFVFNTNQAFLSFLYKEGVLRVQFPLEATLFLAETF